jgi:hypothetical protein
VRKRWKTLAVAALLGALALPVVSALPRSIDPDELRPPSWPVRTAPLPSSPGPLPAEPVAAFVWRRGSSHLALLDPVSLEPVARRGPAVSIVAARSPDGARLVTALGGSYSAEGGAARLRFVDLTTMAVLGEMALGRGGIHSVDWVEEDRVIVVSGHPSSVFVVDPSAGRVLVKQNLETGGIYRVRRVGSRVVVLASAGQTPPGAYEPPIGPTRLFHIDSEGGLRSVDLSESLAGYSFSEGEGGRHRYPGLAVDPEGNRAFVVGEGEPVAEIDLDSMDVQYHSLGGERTLWSRLVDWLVPSAEAKASDGPTRHAEYLPTGYLIVWGEDERVPTRRVAGVILMDVGTWEAFMLHKEMSQVAITRRLFVAWDSVVSLGTGRSPARHSAGVAAYDHSARLLFRELSGQPLCWLDVTDSLAYAYHCGGEGISVIDLATGDVIRRLDPRGDLQLLADEMRY